MGRIYRHCARQTPPIKAATGLAAALEPEPVSSERPREKGQSDGDTDRKEINESEEESPEIEG
jgi:hypothetical protein